MAVSMSIGIYTTYSYDAGAVTLSARDAVSLTALELTNAVRSINLFRKAVVSNDAPVIAPPEAPLVSRVLVENNSPTVYTTRFRCPGFNGGPNLTLDATQHHDTKVTDFEARPERTIAWGDFDLFVRWVQQLTDLATR